VGPFLFEVVVCNGKNAGHSSDNGRLQNHPINPHLAGVLFAKPILKAAAVHISAFEAHNARAAASATLGG
jgi:hypothetical protein